MHKRILSLVIHFNTLVLVLLRLPRLRWIPYGRPRVAAAPIFSLIAIYLRVFFFASEYLSLMSPWKKRVLFVQSFWGYRPASVAFGLGVGAIE